MCFLHFLTFWYFLVFFIFLILYFSIFHVFFLFIHCWFFLTFFFLIFWAGCYVFFFFICVQDRTSAEPPKISIFHSPTANVVLSSRSGRSSRGMPWLTHSARQTRFRLGEAISLPSSPPLPSPSPPLLPLLPLNKCRRQHEKLQEHRCFGSLQVRSATPRSVHSWSWAFHCWGVLRCQRTTIKVQLARIFCLSASSHCCDLQLGGPLWRNSHRWEWLTTVFCRQMHLTRHFSHAHCARLIMWITPHGSSVWIRASPHIHAIHSERLSVCLSLFLRSDSLSVCPSFTLLFSSHFHLYSVLNPFFHVDNAKAIIPCVSANWGVLLSGRIHSSHSFRVALVELSGFFFFWKNEK